MTEVKTKQVHVYRAVTTIETDETVVSSDFLERKTEREWGGKKGKEND
jgi:hypothetical protein